MKKSLAELIDELCITNIKIFILMEDDTFDQKKLKSLNRYRSDLKNAINEEFKQRQEVKTYE